MQDVISALLIIDVYLSQANQHDMILISRNLANNMICAWFLHW